MLSRDYVSTAALARFLVISLEKVGTALGAMTRPTWDVAFQTAADFTMISLEAAKFKREDLQRAAMASAKANRLWASGGEEDPIAALLSLKTLGNLHQEELHTLAGTAAREPLPAQDPVTRVMVMDDSRVSATALSNALAGAGLSVRTVTTMDEALELFFSFAPQVLVSDVFMPEVDVVELCRRFRLATKEERVFVVLVSAGQPADLAARLEMIHPEAFVPKIAGAGAVLAKVQELCGPGGAPATPR